MAQPRAVKYANIHSPAGGEWVVDAKSAALYKNLIGQVSPHQTLLPYAVKVRKPVTVLCHPPVTQTLHDLLPRLTLQQRHVVVGQVWSALSSVGNISPLIDVTSLDPRDIEVVDAGFPRIRVVKYLLVPTTTSADLKTLLREPPDLVFQRQNAEMSRHFAMLICQLFDGPDIMAMEIPLGDVFSPAQDFIHFNIPPEEMKNPHDAELVRKAQRYVARIMLRRVVAGELTNDSYVLAIRAMLAPKDPRKRYALLRPEACPGDVYPAMDTARKVFVNIRCLSTPGAARAARAPDPQRTRSATRRTSARSSTRSRWSASTRTRTSTTTSRRSRRRAASPTRTPRGSTSTS